MSEVQRSYETPHTQRKLELFLGELATQGTKPPGNDRIIGALCLATIDDITNDGPVKDMAADFLANRPSFVVSEAVGAYRAAVQTELQKYEEGFPEDPELEDPRRWQRSLHEIADVYNTLHGTHSVQERSERLNYNLWARRVQTNIPDRYLAAEIAMQSYRHRFPNGVKWLDIGCGILEGQRMLLGKQQQGLTEVDIVTENGDIDALKTSEVRDLLQRDSLIKRAVGVDLMPAYDPNTQQWARGSLRPQKEMRNQEFMRKFDSLIMSPTKETETFGNVISFFDGDLLREETREEFSAGPGAEKFEMVTILTTLHQLPRDQRNELAEIAKSYLDPDNGILVLQDFARVAHHARSPQSLLFYQHWHNPYRYRTFIWDMKEPQKGYQEFARAADSRCQRLMLNTNG